LWLVQLHSIQQILPKIIDIIYSNTNDIEMLLHDWITLWKYWNIIDECITLNDCLLFSQGSLNVSMTCLFFAIENFIIILGIENVVKCKIQEMLRKILLR